MESKVNVKIADEKGNLIDVQGTIMNIKNSTEPWSVYELEDGTIVQLKQTVVQIVKTDKKKANGESLFSIQTQALVNVIEPNKE